MRAYIEVLKPGLYSSIQDLGRVGYLSYGVPRGGAMDQYAHKLANLYLQNQEDAASLEITLVGPSLRFSHPVEIVLTGADLSPVLNDLPIAHSVVTMVNAGDILSFKARKQGARTYLGVRDGFQTQRVLGGRGWFEGITAAFRLEEGMHLPYFSQSQEKIKKKVIQTNAVISELQIQPWEPVGVIAGPEFCRLSNQQQKALVEGEFSIGAHNDRMGIQLEGKLVNSLKPIVTGPVLPGTIQLTPSGTLIVLMRDCQTTGGYPRVLQLTEQGINQLAQRIVGEEVKWRFRHSIE